MLRSYARSGRCSHVGLRAPKRRYAVRDGRHRRDSSDDSAASPAKRLRLIERAANEAAEDTPKPAAVAAPEPKLSVDDALAARLTPPPGVGPVTLQDMDRAIAEGAGDGQRARTASLLGLMNDDPGLVDQVCSIAYEARRTAHLRAVDE